MESNLQYVPAIITGLATLVTALAGLVASWKSYRQSVGNTVAIAALHECLDEHREAVGVDVAEIKDSLKEIKNGAT